jgi:hypothetical protein
MLQRRCVGNGGARQLIVNGKPLNGTWSLTLTPSVTNAPENHCFSNLHPCNLIDFAAPRVYQHPAHPHLVTNVGRAQGWSCALCKFAQQESGEQRQRYHCEQDCQFDLCAECMGCES